MTRPRRKSSSPLAAAEAEGIRAALRSWYLRNRRNLPWRETKDPYAILVSEVMLQQTTVATVIPRYQEFLARFPSFSSLASATEEEVLSLWSGLGYYARARNLKRAAEEIARAGRFPVRSKELRELAGIGEYTAAAVASIAFGEPVATIDGNVVRVLCRLSAWALDPREGPRNPALRSMAATLLDPVHPGDHNQAVMELGATVCLPRNPDCGNCPVRGFCEAAAAGTPEAFPLAAPRPEPVQIRLVSLATRCGPYLYLSRDSEFVQGHWSLPSRRIENQDEEPLALQRLARETGGGRTSAIRFAGRLRHSVLNRRYDVRLHVREIARMPTTVVVSGQWIDFERIRTLSHGGFLRKALRILEHAVSGGRAPEDRGLLPGSSAG